MSFLRLVRIRIMVVCWNMINFVNMLHISIILLFQENLQKLMELQRDLVGLESLVHPDRVWYLLYISEVSWTLAAVIRFYKTLWDDRFPAIIWTVRSKTLFMNSYLIFYMQFHYIDIIELFHIVTLGLFHIPDVANFITNIAACREYENNYRSSACQGWKVF